jgi:hypothetical protein
VAAELSVQDFSQLAVVCCRRFDSYYGSHSYHKFPGNSCGDIKPYKEFKVGVKNGW